MKNLPLFILTIVLINFTDFMKTKDEIRSYDNNKLTKTAEVAKDVTISYTLGMPEPHTHYVEVTMQINNLNQEETDLKMPVWTPGSYLVREFPKSVEDFTASNGRKATDFKKIAKHTWRINTKDISDLTIKYKVYAYELSVRTSYVTSDKAYLNGTSIFMYVDDRVDLPCTINVEPFTKWKQISTGLSMDNGHKWTLKAPNYDVLVDSPILIGNHDIYEFTAVGIPHYIAIDGEGNYDVEQMKKDFIKIAEVETALFDENPCETYTYIILNTESSYGGLEHLNSTSLIFPRWKYQPESSYMRFVSLAAHEYFHLWNVKRIRAKELGPFDYQNENYTQLLWVMEGFTSYYDEYLLRRGEWIGSEQYLNNMLTSVFEYCDNTPGAEVQSLTAASFDAWIKYYRKNENTNNCCVSYYQKGAAVTALLDLTIRHETKGEKSLDDVIHYLYHHYYKELNRGFTDAEMQETLETIAGTSLQEFFDDYIYGTEPLDYNKYLNYVGLEITNSNAGNESPYLGASTKEEDGKLIVTSITRNSAAWHGDLNVHDEIIAINGYRTNEKWSRHIKTQNVGDEVELIINRDGKLRTLKITLGNNPKVNFNITKKENATSDQKKLYEDWMNEKF